MSKKSTASSSEQHAADDPVKVTNVYDTTQLKNALDDQLAKCLTKQWGYQQSHQHTDRKLMLGYVSVLIAAGSFLYEKEYGFDASKWVALGCVIVFWALQAASFWYSRWVENNEIFIGYVYHGHKHVGTLSVTTTMQPYSPKYQITYLYSDVRTQKQTQQESTTSVAHWFTEDGTLVASKFDNFIKTSVDSVAKRLHKD